MSNPNEDPLEGSEGPAGAPAAPQATPLPTVPALPQGHRSPPPGSSELEASGSSAWRAPPEAQASSARWLLLLALLLGATRFLKLGQWGLWIDESLTLNDADQWLRGNAELFRGNVLGIATIAAWIDWLGRWPSEADLRLLPALAGLLGIGLTYWAFAPVAGRRRAAAAAVLVAASSWHLYWSQNARFYTFAQDLGLISSGLLLRAFDRQRAWLAVLAAAVAGLAALAHASGALIFVSTWCASWIVGHPRLGAAGAGMRRPRLALTAAGLAASVVALPWIWQLWREYQAAQVAKSSLGSSLSAITHLVLTTGYYVSPVLALGALAGALIGRRRLFDSFAVAVCLLVAGLVLFAGTQTRVTAQYVFVLLPWIAILAARPFDLSFGPRTPVFAWLALALMAAPGLARQALYFTAHHGARPRWKEAYEYVWSVRDADDLVFGMNPVAGGYYLSPGDANTRMPDRITRLDNFTPDQPMRWARYGKRMWIVVTPEWLEDWQLDDRRRMRAFLIERCSLANHFPLDVETRDLSVWVYRFDPE